MAEKNPNNSKSQPKQKTNKESTEYRWEVTFYHHTKLWCTLWCSQFQFSSSLEGGSKSKEDTERASQKACDDVATALWGEKKVDTLHFEENGEGRCDKALQNRRCNGLAKAS